MYFSIDVCVCVSKRAALLLLDHSGVSTQSRMTSSSSSSASVLMSSGTCFLCLTATILTFQTKPPVSHPRWPFAQPGHLLICVKRFNGAPNYRRSITAAEALWSAAITLSKLAYRGRYLLRLPSSGSIKNLPGAELFFFSPSQIFIP